MFSRIFLTGVLVVALSTVEGGSKCPPRTKVHPCRCHEIIQNAQTFTLVTCSGFNSSSEFLNVPRLLDRMMIDRLVIEDYNVSNNSPLSLPNGWFANIRFRELETYNVKLVSTIGQPLFLQGQESTLIKIALQNSLDASAGMQLASLTLAKNLREIDLSWNKITGLLDQHFPSQFDALQALDLSHNRISQIGARAFQLLRKLNKINLSYNMITTLPVNMFVSHISVMDFSYNMISSVPADMFSNTRLQSRILFAHNNLESFPMDTWLSAMRLASILDVSGNFLTCNCSLAWIGNQAKKDSQLFGSCSNFGEVELQSLRNISLTQNCTAII